jgi:hypothetical protein
MFLIHFHFVFLTFRFANPENGDRIRYRIEIDKKYTGKIYLLQQKYPSFYDK